MLESGVLEQLLLICALWQLVGPMHIMKWGFTAGTWQELASSSLKRVECLWMSQVKSEQARAQFLHMFGLFFLCRFWRDG